MFRVLLILCWVASLIFDPEVASGQSYDPLPNAPTRYNYDHYKDGDFKGRRYLILDPSRKAKRDSSYHPVKLYLSDSSARHLGNIRENGGKVIYRPKDTTASHLVWDFSAEVGDTLRDLFAYDRRFHEESVLFYDAVITHKERATRKSSEPYWKMRYQVLRFKRKDSGIKGKWRDSAYEEWNEKSYWIREKTGTGEGLLMVPYLGEIGIHKFHHKKHDRFIRHESSDTDLAPITSPSYCKDPYPPFPSYPVEFNFQMVGNERMRGLKRGRRLTLKMRSQGSGSLDTTFTITGNLRHRFDSTLLLSTTTMDQRIDGNGFLENTKTHFSPSKTKRIEMREIRELSYQPRISHVFRVLCFSSIAGTVLAPVFSIDKRYPNNFNSDLFIKLSISGWASSIAFGIGWTSTDKRKIRLPPPSSP